MRSDELKVSLVLIFMFALALTLVLAGCGNSDGQPNLGRNNGGSGFRWYLTCGDPVCGTEPPPARTCGTREPGDACSKGDATCDPGQGCGVVQVCADEDPTEAGCPDSLRSKKQDVAYLGDLERQKLAETLLSIRLATYRYRRAPEAERLGFIIDDAPGSLAVLPRGDRVDLYGYTSMAVATIQEQARQIAKLEARLERLEEHLRRSSP